MSFIAHPQSKSQPRALVSLVPPGLRDAQKKASLVSPTPGPSGALLTSIGV